MNLLSKTLIVLFISFLIILPCRAQDYNVESSKYMVDGMEALMNNDYETAFDNFSKELKDNPKNVQALVLVACYYKIYVKLIKRLCLTPISLLKLLTKKNMTITQNQLLMWREQIHIEISEKLIKQ